MDKPLWGLRVQKVQRVQRVQRERFLGLTGPMGRRVLKFDGLSGRGLWYRPQGDEYYNAAFRRSRPHRVSYSFLPSYIPSPLRGPLPLKGTQGALRDWLSVSYVTQYLVPPIFSFPLEGKSREAGKGVRGRAPIGWSIAVLTANSILLIGSLRSPPLSGLHLWTRLWHEG